MPQGSQNKIDDESKRMDPSRSAFDGFATSYEEALQKGLSVSGESSDYFAEWRVRWTLLRCADRKPTKILDYGCGTGNAIPHLLQQAAPIRVIGVDTSAESLRIAESQHACDSVEFLSLESFLPNAECDLAYCNGVFHHIPLDARDAAVDCVFRALASGGLFAFWENNPWNPGTQYVMSRIPFDRDAIKISIPAAKKLLEKRGFRVQTIDSRFYFPKMLAGLRWFEPALCKLPLGAQYMVLAEKP